MQPTWHKMLATLMVMIIAVAVPLCACPTADAAPAPHADAHACCKTEQPQPPAPCHDDPCQHCNSENAPPKITPDQKTTLAGHELLIGWLAPQILPIHSQSADHSVAPITADLPPPPLLDLFHSFCLLTI